MKNIIFSLFAMIIFSGIAVAQSENAEGCQKFKMIVVAPPENTNFKLKVKKPNHFFEFKDAIIDPCKIWAVPQKPQYPHIVQWSLPFPHPFIELSRKPKTNNSNKVPRIALQLPENTKRLINQ